MTRRKAKAALTLTEISNSQKQLGALHFKTCIYLNSGGLKIENEKPRKDKLCRTRKSSELSSL